MGINPRVRRLLNEVKAELRKVCQASENNRKLCGVLEELIGKIDEFQKSNARNETISLAEILRLLVYFVDILKHFSGTLFYKFYRFIAIIYIHERKIYVCR